MRIVQRSFQLLHKVDLLYKIIPSCNTQHTSAVCGVIKHLESLKTLFYYSIRKVHIFATLFRYLTLLRRDWRENSLFCTSVPSSSIVAASKYCHFCGRNQTPALYLRYRVHLVFCKFIVNSNTISFHHTMAVKHHLKDYEIESQLNCKICDVGLHSQMLQRLPYKSAIQLNERGGGKIYIKKITKKKGVCT
jgi:hypothetical protein